MAPIKCCVVGCTSTNKTHRLYKLPKDNKLRSLWLSGLVSVNSELLGLSKDQLLNKHVCQKHFDKYQLDDKGNRLIDGYPGLFSTEELEHGVPLSGDLYDHNCSKKETHTSSTSTETHMETIANQDVEEIAVNPVVAQDVTTFNVFESSEMPSTSKCEKSSHNIQIDSLEKLPMCRICLVQNVRMYVVVNRSLQELYEKLTDVPFVTEDRRPNLACFFCCAKLKQCYRLLRQCLEAEELFAQMMNKDYEPNSLINQNHLEFCSGFIISPIVHISIVDKCQTENIAIKKEFPAVCEELDDIIEPKKEHHIIEPKEEHQSDELEPDKLDNSCLDVADTPPHQYESDLEDDVPLMEIKIEVEEEQEVSKKNRRARETQRATVAKKPKLDTRRTKLEDAITAEQMKEDKSNSIDIRTTQKCTSKSTYVKEPLKSDQCSFNRKNKTTRHTRTHTGEKPYKCDVCQRSFNRNDLLSKHIRIHTNEKPFKCNVCQRSFSQKPHLSDHIRIHSGEKPFKCNVCQRSFSKQCNLTTHKRTHISEKPFKCDECQRSFNTKHDLTKHIRVHTGEKPFKCNLCQRSFSQKGHLSDHLRIHSGEKPFRCVVCQRSFSIKNQLTQHIRVHSGILYKCDVCQRSYSSKSNLRQHVRKHTSCQKPFKCM